MVKIYWLNVCLLKSFYYDKFNVLFYVIFRVYILKSFFLKINLGGEVVEIGNEWC